MPRYCKKPLEVEALRVREILLKAKRSFKDLPVWLKKAYEAGDIILAGDSIRVMTLEGEMRADKGDWLIRGIQGELYPCKNDIFNASYDPMDPAL